MNEVNNWEQRFEEWKKQVGFKNEPTALDVFQKMIENREKDNDALLNNLQSHFDQIEVILQETPSERPNK